VSYWVGERVSVSSGPSSRTSPWRCRFSSPSSTARRSGCSPSRSRDGRVRARARAARPGPGPGGARGARDRVAVGARRRRRRRRPVPPRRHRHRVDRGPQRRGRRRPHRRRRRRVVVGRQRGIRVDERLRHHQCDRPRRDQVRAVLPRAVAVAPAHPVAWREGHHRADDRHPAGGGGQRRPADAGRGPRRHRDARQHRARLRLPRAVRELPPVPVLLEAPRDRPDAVRPAGDRAILALLGGR